MSSDTTNTRSASDLKFAYWVPNVSGGLVISKIEQRTDWSLDYNVKLARLAESSGFEYALSQVRYMASYGAEFQHESTTFSFALLQATQRLKVIAAVHPGLWHPGVLAKLVATQDLLSQGRSAVNVVSGWFKGEFTALGEPWLEHDERYRRSEEFIRVLRGSWTEDNFSFSGDFYRIHGYNLKPKPLHRPHPEIFQGGTSRGARDMAARVSDWYFCNGNTVERNQSPSGRYPAKGGGAGRPIGAPKIGMNAFIIARDTEEEARRVLADIIKHADAEAVNAFGDAVKQAGKASPEGQGNWATSTFDDLVQYNDGFRPNLVGTPEQIARAHPRLQEPPAWTCPRRIPPLSRGGRILRQTGPSARSRARETGKAAA